MVRVARSTCSCVESGLQKWNPSKHPMVTSLCAPARLFKSVPMLELLVAGCSATLTASCGSQGFRPNWALDYSATHILKTNTLLMKIFK